MSPNLADDSAQLVHPSKAFVLRHIPLPSMYHEDRWESYLSYYSSSSAEGRLLDHVTDPELVDYLLRLHGAVDTLFGTMDLELHCNRSYDDGLGFHRDIDDYDDDGRELVRLATCVHNATDQDRPLTFARPTWTNHTESFSLVVPAKAILAFSGALTTDYEHGIESGSTRSVVTRFARWA